MCLMLENRGGYHCSQRRTGVYLSQVKIDEGAVAKQNVLWAGMELVTRYTESGNAPLCQKVLLFSLLLVVVVRQPCCPS
jgi:hypothetical protein